MMDAAALLGVLIVMLLALMFRQWRELAVRRVELGRQLERRQQLLDQFKAEIDGTSGELDLVENELGELNGSVAELQQQADALEAELQALKSRPRDNLVLLDRASLQARTFWEVELRHPTFAETATARFMPKRHVEEWVAGRLFLVGADSAEDAVKRVLNRFSAALGYQVGAVVPFRRHNRH